MKKSRVEEVIGADRGAVGADSGQAGKLIGS